MLHKETVDPLSIKLLTELQEKPYLDGFFLVGGTALALLLGHRKSIDLDLFSDFDFDVSELLESLQQDYQYQMFYSAKNTLKGAINGINIDILAHRYPYIGKPLSVNDIKMLSIPDIIAMKLNAISGSGQRVKDFIDIFFLLRTFDLDEMIKFYKNKYALNNEAVALKSLVYFDDIDFSDWPELISEPELQWKTIAQSLENEVMNYSRRKIF
jgi:hypothetical protein